MPVIAAISDFIGRFHPVLVHLPIGILILAVIFYFLSGKKKFEILKPAVRLTLSFGVMAAIASCISGFFLSQSGGYDGPLVTKHQWFGIGLTVIAGAAWIFYTKGRILVRSLMLLIAVLLIITGHLGGTLTHGENYLTQSSAAGNDKAVFKPVPDVQKAVVYTDIIKPILQAKCYNCHGPAKQKGRLRLDEPDHILKGGENGKTVIPGNAGESELIKRLLLPADNEDHMPPKAKPQLTKTQVELLNWWVSSGADFTKKTEEINQPGKIKTSLKELESGAGNEMVTAVSAGIPAEAVSKAPDSVIQQLRELDVSVSAVVQNGNYLSVSFAATDSITDKQMLLLKQISRQLIWLKLGGAKIHDKTFAEIGTLKSLTRLSLDRTPVTDRSIGVLKNLSGLQYLNLSFTSVTEKGLMELSGLKKLQQLYLYQSGVKAENHAALKKIFPHTAIDTGGYKLQFLVSDTMLAKPKEKKK